MYMWIFVKSIVSYKYIYMYMYIHIYVHMNICIRIQKYTLINMISPNILVYWIHVHHAKSLSENVNHVYTCFCNTWPQRSWHHGVAMCKQRCLLWNTYIKTQYVHIQYICMCDTSLYHTCICIVYIYIVWSTTPALCSITESSCVHMETPIDLSFDIRRSLLLEHRALLVECMALFFKDRSILWYAKVSVDGIWGCFGRIQGS